MNFDFNQILARTPKYKKNVYVAVNDKRYLIYALLPNTKELHFSVFTLLFSLTFSSQSTEGMSQIYS